MEAQEIVSQILKSTDTDKLDQVLKILLHDTLKIRGLQFGDARITLREPEDKQPRISIITDRRQFEILDNGIIYEYDPKDNTYMKMW